MSAGVILLSLVTSAMLMSLPNRSAGWACLGAVLTISAAVIL